LAALSLVLLSLIAQSLYFQAGFIEDDRQHLGGAGHAHAGQTSITSYVLLPHNEHVLPAWRVWYFSTWRLFGMQPLPWHLAIAISHAVGSLALWRTLVRYLEFPLAAWFGAALWAGAAIGYADSPLVWIAASHLAFAVDWLLIAMVCVTHIAAPRQWFWATAMCLTAALSVQWMGALLVLLPVLAVQIIWLESAAPRRRKLVWLSLLAGVMLVTGVTQSILLKLYSTREIEPLSSLDPGLAIVKIVVQVAGAASSLIGATLHVDGIPPDAGQGETLLALLRANVSTLILPALLALATVTAIAVWGGARRRRVLVWAFLPALIYFFLLHVARSNVPLTTTAVWGRYYFLAVISWCVVAALAVDLLFSRANPADRSFYRWLLVPLVCLQLWGQARVAHSAAADFAEREAKNHEFDLPRDELLKALSATAQREQRPLRAPEMMIYDPPFLQQLSRYIEYRFPAGIPGLEIVSGEQVTDQDLANLLTALQSIDTPLARQWEGYWQASAAPRQLLLELSHSAVKEGHSLYLPNLSVNTPEFGIPLDKFREQVFPGGLPGVQILTAEQFLPDVPWLPTISALHASRNPLARQWLEVVQQVQAATQGPRR
jgi:hypothetical protein